MLCRSNSFQCLFYGGRSLNQRQKSGLLGFSFPFDASPKANTSEPDVNDIGKTQKPTQGVKNPSGRFFFSLSKNFMSWDLYNERIQITAE